MKPVPTNSKNTRWVGALCLSLALVGCKETQLPEPADADVALRRMASCDDLRERVGDVLIEQLAGGWGYRGGPEVDMPAEDDAAGGDGGSNEEPSDFTGTNNQEEGVDELDLVKTNGTHLFVAQDQHLHVVQSWPAADTQKLATIDLGGWANGLFQADDDTLVVLVSADRSSLTVDDAETAYSFTRALIVDVSDPASPTITREELIEGYLTSARMVDGEIVMVINQPINPSNTIWDAAYQAIVSVPQPNWDASEASWDAYRQTVRERVTPIVRAEMASVSLDALLPGARTGSTGALTSMYACEDIYAPTQLGNLAMLGVAHLDPATPGVRGTGVMADGWITYASTDHLYVAQTSWWWWGWGEEPPRTHIHKFDITASTPAYVGSGAVDGWLYGQFAMSEHDGFLRAVTTDFGWSGSVGGGDVAVSEPPSDGGGSDEGDAGGGGSSGDEGGEDAPDREDEAEPVEDPPDEPVEEPSEEPATSTGPANNLYVLGPTATGDLEVVGHVGGIAPGEQIYAARMMGEKGYVITFRQVDPLYTLDLSDPTDPRILGELKIPGYSAYLHPLDADHLIGVGMAGTDEGQLTGLQVVVFDVSDMSNPVQEHAYAIDPGENAWAWSEALWDHHAFTFHRDVLTIPAYSQSWDPVTGEWQGFSGTISLMVTPDGIEELGRVHHDDLIADSVCLYDLWWSGDRVDDGKDDVTEPSPGEEVPPSEEPDGEETPRDDEGEVDPDEGGASEPDVEPGWDGDWSYCDQPGYGWANVRRSVYIEDYLYTVSTYGIKVNDLMSPDVEVARALFFPEAE